MTTSGNPFTQQTNKSLSSEKLANEIRDSINGSLINVGVLAALMMALAGAIYVDPPEPPGRCHGEPMLMAEMVIVWMAMGFFFFSTISSVVLYMDLDGIPSDMLLYHLQSSQTPYILPQVATALGIFMTALAYGIDIGERGGCPFFIFGIIAAPCFVLSIVVLWIVCRKRRQALINKHNAIGNGNRTGDCSRYASFLATWADRIPSSAEGQPA